MVSANLDSTCVSSSDSPRYTQTSLEDNLASTPVLCAVICRQCASVGQLPPSLSTLCQRMSQPCPTCRLVISSAQISPILIFCFGVNLSLLSRQLRGAKYMKLPALTLMSTPQSKCTHSLSRLTVLQSSMSSTIRVPLCMISQRAAMSQTSYFLCPYSSAISMHRMGRQRLPPRSSRSQMGSDRLLVSEFRWLVFFLQKRLLVRFSRCFSASNFRGMMFSMAPDSLNSREQLTNISVMVLASWGSSGFFLFKQRQLKSRVARPSTPPSPTATFLSIHKYGLLLYLQPKSDNQQYYITHQNSLDLLGLTRCDTRGELGVVVADRSRCDMRGELADESRCDMRGELADESRCDMRGEWGVLVAVVRAVECRFLRLRLDFSWMYLMKCEGSGRCRLVRSLCRPSSRSSFFYICLFCLMRSISCNLLSLQSFRYLFSVLRFSYSFSSSALLELRFLILRVKIFCCLLWAYMFRSCTFSMPVILRILLQLQLYEASLSLFFRSEGSVFFYMLMLLFWMVNVASRNSFNFYFNC